MFGWLGWMLATGFLSAPAQGAAMPKLRYSFQVRIKTEAAQASEALTAVLGPGVWTLTGDLVVTPTQRFRDGSIGHRLRFESVEETLEGEDKSIASPLTGRTVELRTFEDGEVLDVRDGQHIAGWGRGGDWVDILLPLVSPAPPEFKKEDALHRRLIWPFRMGRVVRWDNAVEANWTRRPVARSKEVEAHDTLEYRGPWKLDGYDRRTKPPVRITGSGELSGTLDLDKEGLRTHKMVLKRTVTLTVYGGTDVVQTHLVEASLQRKEVGPTTEFRAVDLPPLAPRYLNVNRVNQVVQGAAEGLKSCEARGPELTLPIRLAVKGDGSSQILKGAENLACIRRVLIALRFPTHDGMDAAVHFTVYRRGGRFSVSPLAVLKEPKAGPVLLHPVKRAPQAVLQAAAKTLGLPPGETRPAQR